MMKDSSLKKIISYGKWKDVVDLSSLECRIALVVAVFFSHIFYYCMKGNDGNLLQDTLEALSKDIALAMIGFLGFTVAGLAILTGIISSKIVHQLLNENKEKVIERILLSFYLLGLVIAIVILGLFGIYLLPLSGVCFKQSFLLILLFLFTYLFCFIIFYAVKLIGNSLEIFFIISGATIETERDESIKRVSSDGVKNVFNSYRITALESVVLSDSLDRFEKYKETMEKQVRSSDKNSDLLVTMFEDYFQIKK